MCSWSKVSWCLKNILEGKVRHLENVVKQQFSFKFQNMNEGSKGLPPNMPIVPKDKMKTGLQLFLPGPSWDSRTVVEEPERVLTPLLSILSQPDRRRRAEYSVPWTDSAGPSSKSRVVGQHEKSYGGCAACSCHAQLCLLPMTWLIPASCNRRTCTTGTNKTR